MNETPVPSPPALVESPVPDPQLFLMYERNRAYLLGKTALPHLAHRDEESNLAGVILFGGLGVMFLLFGGGNFLLQWLSENNRDFGNPTLVVIGLFLLILLAMGVTVVARDMQLGKSAAKGNGTPGESEGLTPSKPQILEGSVTHAEKIRDEHGIARLGVRYQFAAPGGIVTDGYSEGACEDASHEMAPVPGTPVKIYYMKEQKYYLL